MSIHFQPKIIIGSVVGFIATAIGVIAVFFPSLFNLETKKINNFSIEITSCESAKKLFDFLKSHEDEIVSLNISYIEPEVFSNEYNVNFIKGSKDENTKNIYKNFDREWLEDTEGRSASLFGEDNLFNVVSDSKIYSYESQFVRDNGGFGFWCKNYNQKNDKDLDFTYQIAIPYKSNGNTLYYWGDKGENAGNHNDKKMYLEGIFFVNKLVNESQYAKEEKYYMYPDYCQEKFFDYDAEKCYPPDIFDIEPLSKKEIESKKY